MFDYFLTLSSERLGWGFRPIKSSQCHITDVHGDFHKNFTIKISLDRLPWLRVHPNEAQPLHCYRLSRPQGHSAAERWSQWKIPMIIWGIETATFLLVCRCLNQLHHCNYCTEIYVFYLLKNQNWAYGCIFYVYLLVSFCYCNWNRIIREKQETKT